MPGPAGLLLQLAALQRRADGGGQAVLWGSAVGLPAGANDGPDEGLGRRGAAVGRKRRGLVRAGCGPRCEDGASSPPAGPTAPAGERSWFLRMEEPFAHGMHQARYCRPQRGCCSRLTLLWETSVCPHSACHLEHVAMNGTTARAAGCPANRAASSSPCH